MSKETTVHGPDSSVIEPSPDANQADVPDGGISAWLVVLGVRQNFLRFWSKLTRFALCFRQDACLLQRESFAISFAFRPLILINIKLRVR
jgi:hypothetical protein